MTQTGATTDLLRQAMQRHQSGRLRQAEALYRQVLERTPEQPDALNLLGVLRHTEGDHGAAVDLIGKALAARPVKEIPVKKSVLALILVAVFVIIVSPAIVGRLAEDRVGENLNWAAEESGELVVTSQGFDRGWFSSEGQHRVELGEGSIRAGMTPEESANIPVLLINTRIDHGLIPLSSLSRDKGSLAPGPPALSG